MNHTESSLRRATIAALMRRTTIAVILLGQLSGCAPTETSTPTQTIDPVSEQAPPSPVRNDDHSDLAATANGLAGLEANHAELEHHQAKMSDLWATMKARHLEPLEHWRQHDLGPLPAPELPLLYFFGGPDLLNARAFFPEAESYLLVGLEPPGPIPSLATLEPDTLAAELERIRRALINMTAAGYFVTHRMADDLVSDELTGIQPLLFVFIAQSGYLPTEVEFIGLNEDGSIREAADHERSAVRIRISPRDESRTARTVYYFSRDLSNSGLESDPSFRRFLEQQAPFNSYIKSASYLLHLDTFSISRQVLIEGATTIVQDDSGVPYRFLTEADFELRLFGVFTHTHAAFGEWFQQDLADAFSSDASTQPLEFAIGYQAKIGGGGLIRADRR